ncbi:hypothetical protein [Marinibacterium sp. SX1]|uniref:hypothetical protein n=1 Tax=Marinibacterium sp. SX1 TaxID=3388424 RepID=UPI003D16358C
MPKNANVSCAPGTWTELTDADVAAIRLQNLGGYAVDIMATSDTSAPSSAVGALRLDPHDILPANVGLSDVFPGVAAGYRVWARFELGGTLSVSHA